MRRAALFQTHLEIFLCQLIVDVVNSDLGALRVSESPCQPASLIRKGVHGSWLTQTAPVRVVVVDRPIDGHLDQKCKLGEVESRSRCCTIVFELVMYPFAT
jgi:hypothetical protein